MKNQLIKKILIILLIIIAIGVNIGNYRRKKQSIPKQPKEPKKSK